MYEIREVYFNAEGKMTECSAARIDVVSEKPENPTQILGVTVLATSKPVIEIKD